MHRQKIRLLRRLSDPQILRLLPVKALKLYLVLLVSAKRIGREQVIEAQIMRGALGRHLTHLQLQRIAAPLERLGLATLRPPQSGHRHDILHFRVLNRRDRGTDGGWKARAPSAGRGR